MMYFAEIDHKYHQRGSCCAWLYVK